MTRSRVDWRIVQAVRSAGRGGIGPLGLARTLNIRKEIVEFYLPSLVEVGLLATDGVRYYGAPPVEKLIQSMHRARRIRQGVVQ